MQWGEFKKKVVEVSASVEQMTAVSNQILDSVAVAKQIAEKSVLTVKKVLQQQKNNLRQWRKFPHLHNSYLKWRRTFKILLRSLISRRRFLNNQVVMIDY